MKKTIERNVIERLRASKQRSEAAEYQLGHAIGKRWAEQSAATSELQRLEELRDEYEAQPQYDWDEFFEWDEPRVWGPDEDLFFAMHPEAGKDRRAAEDFWECAAGDALQQSLYRGVFLKGFAEGAIAVWESVQDKL
ncbi:MAG: hypothetical protein NTY19_01100 [Planctomycetota bacterium]|nr:hypothetical protein [Planctomycetota bacterium]